jgi:RecB family exonuclease
MYAYVHTIKSPPRLRAVRGIAVHLAVEVDMRQKMTSMVDLPIDDMLDAYDEKFEREVGNGYEEDAAEDIGEVKDRGYDLVRLYHRQAAPSIQPVLVEEPLSFSINGQTYTGQIDLATRDDAGKLVIRDTKTTARSPSPSQYQLNMVGYAVAARQRTGETEADTVLDYLVATNQPKYLPIAAGGPIPDEQIVGFSQVVADVGAAIKAGRFVPNGLVNGACSWCGYTRICPAFMKKDPTV